MLKPAVLHAIVLALLVCDASAQSAPYFPTCPYGGSDILEIQRAIKAKYTTCVEIVSAYLNRTSTYNGDLKAFISVLGPSALRQAQSLDASYKATKRFQGKLHCVPFMLKENQDVAGLPTTAGAAALAKQVPLKDGVIWARLKAAGAVLIGKANMAQLAEGWPRDAVGSTSASEVGGAAMNPFGAPGKGNFTTDGSSGGSAAGVAAGLAVAATGSDTGGSIQGPASANNVVGIRSPLGAVPEDGELPSFYKQDAPGPIARRVRDAVLVYDVLAKTNLHDKITRKKNLNGQTYCYFNIFEPVPQPPPAPLPPNFVVEPEALALTERALGILRNAGAKITRVIPANPAAALQFLSQQVLPRFLGMSAARNTCFSACEAWSWETYFADPTRFGPGAPFRSAAAIAASPLLHPDFKARLYEAINNTEKLSYEAYCKKKCEVEAKYDELRAELQSALRSLMKDGGDCSAFISPTWSFFPFDQSKPGVTPLEFGPTVMGPYAGWPSVVVPMGFSTPTDAAPKGLPLGLDIIGPTENFVKMLELAVVFQDRLQLVTNPPGTPLTAAVPKLYNLQYCTP